MGLAERHDADYIFQVDEECEGCLKVIKNRYSGVKYMSVTRVNGLLHTSSHVLVLDATGKQIAKNFLYRTFS